MTQTTDTPAGTATTAGARAHAREQHHRTADTMRHIPLTTAPTRVTGALPDGAADSLVWSETLAFGRYTTLQLARGTRLRLTDSGDSCVHTLLYRAGALHERYNAADSVKVPWQAYPGAGHPLLSDAGRLLATIVEDTSGSHDALTGATTLAGNTARYGAGTAHSASPAARELLTLGALKNGLGPRDVAPSLTFFKGVRVDGDGGIRFTGSAGPGAHVDLLLQVDAVVVLANTAHPLDPRADFTGTAVDIAAWRSPGDLAALAHGNLVGPLTPEHQQALNNTEHDLAARSTR
ncbi:urea amidolyase associated protein UAAP1 [Arthrobacter sp. B1805]|uniref:urea amidolyase associated protein UAAP1 n=1 Tax=Arthrobacter sp. B1805 TaxID=2058892 RepID=UPI000CE4BE28|nr:urea amidolyase associated protein UAAP1 [Arthrobacter sp. B1805]